MKCISPSIFYMMLICFRICVLLFDIAQSSYTESLQQLLDRNGPKTREVYEYTFQIFERLIVSDSVSRETPDRADLEALEFVPQQGDQINQLP